MSMDKAFYKSKLFWTNIVIIVSSVGTIFTGEINLDSALPKLLIVGLGILGIIFRWNSAETLNLGIFKKKAI